VLRAYGNPLAVAARYGSPNAGLSFGRELIGPEVFVIYRMVLGTQFVLTLIVVTIINALGASTGGPISRYLEPMAIQFVLTTSIFIAIDAFKRRSQTNSVFNFPPFFLQPIPRWQSVSGFITLSLSALWWAAIPYAPFLILGSAADRVRFTESWAPFYWPALIPLIVGAAQRLATFAEPRWSLLQTMTRLVTNSWSVLLVVQFLSAFPYVAATVADAEPLAQRINNGLWWNSLATFGLYWLINAGFMTYMLAKHVGHYRRKRRDHVLLKQSVHT
jgi:hypothetical protein